MPLCHDYTGSWHPAATSRKNSFGKLVSGVTVRGQGFIDNGFSTRFVTHVPQRRDDWDKGFKDKVDHIVTQLLYQYGHVPVKGDKTLKTRSTTFDTHQCPRYSLLPDSHKGGPIIQWAFSNSLTVVYYQVLQHLQDQVEIAVVEERQRL